MENITNSEIYSVSPHNKEVLKVLPQATKLDVLKSVAQAHEAFHSRPLSLKERLNLIARLKRVISANADEIAQLISQEVGKPISECYACEIASVLDTCQWLVKNTGKYLRRRKVKLKNPLFRSNSCFIDYEPMGVIGIISPWNFPFSIPFTSILQALAAGNTVVLKPSEKSSLTALKIQELVEEAGFPRGFINVVLGDRKTGKHLSQARLISRLILTGSVNAGKNLIVQSASHLTPLTLELGGKDAAIVLPDAPVEFTARGLTWGAFMNAGQACASIERAYIVKGPQTEKLIEAIVAKTGKLVVGSPLHQDTDVGPLIDQNQLDRVAQQVELARSTGAQVLTGGEILSDLGGFFYAPTVVSNVDSTQSYMLEETFGPVLFIQVVDSIDEAIENANSTDFGLTASIWSSSKQAAERIALRLVAGTVYHNDCIFSHACPELPWGGLKLSGLGRTHSEFGLLDMVHIKNTNYNTTDRRGRLWWYPYKTSQTRLMRAGVQLLHGNNLKVRAWALVEAVRSFVKG